MRELSDEALEEALRDEASTNAAFLADLDRAATLDAHAQTLRSEFEFPSDAARFLESRVASLERLRDASARELAAFETASSSGDVELRYAMSPPAVKAEFEDDYRRFADARNWLTRTYYRWQLSDLPDPDRAALAERIETARAELKALEDELAGLGALAGEGAAVFERWYALQRSYVQACPSAACL